MRESPVTLIVAIGVFFMLCLLLWRVWRREGGCDSVDQPTLDRVVAEHECDVRKRELQGLFHCQCPSSAEIRIPMKDGRVQLLKFSIEWEEQ